MKNLVDLVLNLPKVKNPVDQKPIEPIEPFSIRGIGQITHVPTMLCFEYIDMRRQIQMIKRCR